MIVILALTTHSTSVILKMSRCPGEVNPHAFISCKPSLGIFFKLNKNSGNVAPECSNWAGNKEPKAVGRIYTKGSGGVFWAVLVSDKLCLLFFAKIILMSLFPPDLSSFSIQKHLNIISCHKSVGRPTIIILFLILRSLRM